MRRIATAWTSFNYSPVAAESVRHFAAAFAGGSLVAGTVRLALITALMLALRAFPRAPVSGPEGG